MGLLPRVVTAAFWGAALLAAVALGCRAPAPAAPVEATAARAPPSSSSSFNPCSASKPVPHPYKGILRVARCEQDMYLTMAGVADQLGVDCRFCHAPLVENGHEVPKKEDYPVMTDRKLAANWMSTELMQSIKTADGSKMSCKSCHTDDDGQAGRQDLRSAARREEGDGVDERRDGEPLRHARRSEAQVQDSATRARSARRTSTRR